MEFFFFKKHRKVVSQEAGGDDVDNTKQAMKNRTLTLVHLICGVGVPCALQCTFPTVPISKIFDVGCGANLSFSMTIKFVFLELIGLSFSWKVLHS